MTLTLVSAPSFLEEYAGWVDLVSDLARSSATFPRDVLSDRLSVTFRARAFWVSGEVEPPDLERIGIPPDLRHQLAIPCRLASASYRIFVMARRETEFSEEEVELARRLQPLFALLDRNCHTAGELAETTAPGLTERELAVLGLLSEGCTARAIAHRLGISPRTVHVHLQNIYRKLGVSDRLLAARIYRESGRFLAAVPS